MCIRDRSIREASKTGKSGFVWHTTGSGKTLTSYKATRNLLMDIPAIDKAIFLIDRKDLDTQTTMEMCIRDRKYPDITRFSDSQECSCWLHHPKADVSGLPEGMIRRSVK